MHKHHKHSIFIIIAGLIAAFILFRFVGTTNLTEVFLRSNKRLIFFAILLQIPLLFFWNLKWKLVFNFVKQKVSFWKLWLILLIGNFGDTISPGSRIGGEPLRVLYLQKLGYKPDISLTTILLERVYNLIVFLFFALFSFAFAFIELSLPIWLLIIMAGAFFVVLLLSYLLFHAFYHEKRGIKFMMRVVSKVLPLFYKIRHTRLHKEYKTYGKFYNHILGIIKHFFDEVVVLSKNKLLWAEGVFLSFAYWFTFYLQAWILFKAVNISVPFYFIIVIITLTDLVGFLTFIPSGAGVVEILMVVFATSIGIPVAGAAAATLLSRGIYYIFSLTSGYLSMLYFSEK